MSALIRPGRWRVALAALLTTSLLLAAGCAASPQHIDDTVALRHSVQEFHKNLRWSRFEEAAVMVSPEHRQTFLGRYEELGEDFHITELEVKSVVYDKDEKNRPIALVETEQHWYRERTMTVKKDKFVETWRRDHQGWQMITRETKDELLKRKKREAAQARRAKTPQDRPPRAADERAADEPTPDERAPDERAPDQAQAP